MAEPRLNNDRRPRRITAEPSIRRPPVAVNASPVDTYVSPKRETKASQLAEALAGIQPSVGRFSETLANRAIEDDIASAKAAAEAMATANEEDKKKIAEGMPAIQSPWYMAAFEEHSGRHEAMLATSEMAVAMEQDPRLQAAESMEEFEAFQSAFKDEWLSKHSDKGERFKAAFNSYYASDVGTRRRPAFTKRLTKNIEQRFAGATRGQTINLLTEDIPDAPLEEQALNLSILRQSMLDVGRSPQAVDKDILEGIKEAAFASGSMRPFQLVKHLESAYGGVALGNTDEGSKFIREAKLEFSQEMERRRKEDERLAKERREELQRGSAKKLYAVLSSDLNGDYKPIIDELAQEDPEAATEFLAKAKRIVSNYDSLSKKDDNLAALYRWRIRDPNNRLTQPEIDEAVATNQLSIEQGMDLTERLDNYHWKVRNRNKDDSHNTDLLKNANYREVMQFVDQAITINEKNTGYWERIKVHSEIADSFEDAVENNKVNPKSTADVMRWARENADPIIQGRLGTKRESTGTSARPTARDPREGDNKTPSKATDKAPQSPVVTASTPRKAIQISPAVLKQKREELGPQGFVEWYKRQLKGEAN